MQEVLSVRSVPRKNSSPPGSCRLALYRHPKSLLAHAPQACQCSGTMLSLDELMPDDAELGLISARCRTQPRRHPAPRRAALHLLHQADPESLRPCALSLCFTIWRNSQPIRSRRFFQFKQGTVRIRLTSGTPERAQGDEPNPPWNSSAHRENQPNPLDETQDGPRPRRRATP